MKSRYSSSSSVEEGQIEARNKRYAPPHSRDNKHHRHESKRDYRRDDRRNYKKSSSSERNKYRSRSDKHSVSRASGKTN